MLKCCSRASGRGEGTYQHGSPLPESGHLLLMCTLAARANVAEALAAYERLRVLLRDELGVAPSEVVQEAYLRLLG
jgi:SARP family transcriptional regulator, regulator of embCAB operon